MAGQCYFSRFRWVFVLPMTAFLILEIPAIVYESPDDLAHLHSLFPIHGGVKSVLRVDRPATILMALRVVRGNLLPHAGDC